MDQAKPARLTLPKAIGTVLATGLGVACLGGVVGLSIAKVMPAYYRAVFVNGNDPGFQPVPAGTGLGITQGLVGGLAIGTIIVVALAWRDRRAHVNGQCEPIQADRAGWWRWGVWLVVAGVSVLLALGVGSVGLLIGLLIGEQGAYQRHNEQERQLVVAALADDPVLSALEIQDGSNGNIWMIGSVPTGNDLERLRERVTIALGASRCDEVIRGVDVQAE